MWCSLARASVILRVNARKDLILSSLQYFNSISAQVWNIVVTLVNSFLHSSKSLFRITLSFANAFEWFSSNFTLALLGMKEGVSLGT